MNFHKASFTILWIAAQACFVFSSRSQTYYFSGPVSGHVEVALNGGLNASLTPPPVQEYFGISFGTISETLIPNAGIPGVSATLEAIGSLTLSPSSGAFNLYAPGGTDPNLNGYQQVGTVSLTVGNNNSFTFDTVFTANGSTFTRGASGNILVPVEGTGTYNGQPFTTSWQIAMPVEITGISITQSSLTFSQESSEYPLDADGFSESFTTSPSLTLYPSDVSAPGVDFFDWQISNATATLVPEPSPIALTAVGLALFAFRRLKAER